MSNRNDTLDVNLKVTITGIEWLEPLVRRINWKLENIMATLQERFDAVSAKLDEASAEILAEIAKLREGGTLTPEQEAALAAIEAKANALGNISPPLA